MRVTGLNVRQQRQRERIGEHGRDEPAEGGDMPYVRQHGCQEISDGDTQGDNRGPVADKEDGDRQKITVREEGV